MDINQYIREICPDGVEYKQLCDVAEYSSDRISAENITNCNYIGVDNLLPDKRGKKDATNVPIGNTLTAYRTNDILIGNIRPYLKKIWLATNCGGTNGDVLVIRITDASHIRLLPRYLYYVLASDKFFYYTVQYSKGGKMPRGDKTSILRYDIPVPPLPVQEEIVRILDKFTALEAELEAELEARGNQYEHYLECLFAANNKELLSSGIKVVWKTLGEIGDVTKLAGFEFTEHVKYANEGSIIALRGLNVKNGRLDLSEVKYIDHSNFAKLSRSKLIIDDMLFTYIGTIGQVALIDSNDKYYLAPNVARIRFVAKECNPVFMRYYFQTHFFMDKQINRYLSTSSMKNLTMEKIRKFLIPVPPLEEQARIVAILDRFDALTHSITQGLPAEIAARRKQYEHYRDRLLTFKEKVS